MSSKPNTSKGCIWGIISLLITPFVLFYSGQLIIEEQDRQITSSTVISLTISMVALIFSLVKCKIFKPLAAISGSGYGWGRQDGLEITCYKNGEKKRETNFKDGKLDGPMNAWHENGHKKFETHFKDGIIEGLWTEWHKNGHKSLEDNYKDGKPDGLSVQWHENGQKMAEGNYKDGKPDGLLRGWHDNGQKKGELTYKDRKMISEKYWNSKGEQVDSLDEAKVE
ncbi:toxin-antitoxin system YwqK family antitoxin [Verrucomicrobiales bacterium]|nr:toxin-antitoxin system YwqK family antitoxin [Verrucomicrobiales bacterium]